MAVRGPKPQMPLSIQALIEGLNRPRVEKEVGPLPPVLRGPLEEPPDGEMKPSEVVGRDPAALDYFEFYVRTAPKGVLKPLDLPLLEKLCIYNALFDKTVVEYAAGGLTQTSENTGLVMKMPHFDMLSRLGEMVRKFTIELALTPVERTRMKLGAVGNGTEGEQKLRELRNRFIDRVDLGGQAS